MEQPTNKDNYESVKQPVAKKLKLGLSKEKHAQDHWHFISKEVLSKRFVPRNMVLSTSWALAS